MNTKSIETIGYTIDLQTIKKELERKKAFVEKVVNEVVKYETRKNMVQNLGEYSQTDEKPFELRKTYTNDIV